VSFTILECEQRSPEWYAARAGRLTGSRAAAVFAKIQTGEAAARRDLRMLLACERLTGVPQDDGYVSKEMQRGIDKESEALGMYEAESGLIVRRTGFLAHDSLPVGCSLDGDIEDFTGLVEVKVPKSATHLKWLRAAKLPFDHLHQCLHNLWVTGAQWCDFVSYDDRFPAHLQYFCVRLHRDDREIEAYEKGVLDFLAEVAKEVGEISKLRAAA